jgi:hypothetical protein
MSGAHDDIHAAVRKNPVRADEAGRSVVVTGPEGVDEGGENGGWRILLHT